MQREQPMFSKDMTTTQIIYGLIDYNTAILDRIYNREDYSDLLTEFRESKVIENPHFKNAYQIYNLTQPEFYLADTGINITPEAYYYIETFDNEVDPEFYYKEMLDVESIMLNLYSSLSDFQADDYKLKLTGYDEEIAVFKRIAPKDHNMPKQKRLLERRLEEYRALCKKWKTPRHFDNTWANNDTFRGKYRYTFLADIQNDVYDNIKKLMTLRSEFVPAFVIDYYHETPTDDPDTLDSGIYEKVKALEETATFCERYDLVFKEIPSFKKAQTENRFLIRPIAVKGGSISKFIEKTLKTKSSELHKNYNDVSNIFQLSDVNRHFIIILFFYLCLPFEEFESFLNYHGYATPEYIPLINGRASIDERNKAYYETANIFYGDIKKLYDHGLSYNTMLVVLFGESAYAPDKFK